MTRATLLKFSKQISVTTKDGELNNRSALTFSKLFTHYYLLSAKIYLIKLVKPIYLLCSYPDVHHQIIHENIFLLLYVFLVIHAVIHSHNQRLHQAAFPEAPQPLRYITQNRLLTKR